MQYANGAQELLRYVTGSDSGGQCGLGRNARFTTPSIVPNAANGLVITSFVSEDTAAATASTGCNEYFSYGSGLDPSGAPTSSLDVQLATAPTTDPTDAVSNTFAGAFPALGGEANIFQIPPSSFVGSQAIHRNASGKPGWLR